MIVLSSVVTVYINTSSGRGSRTEIPGTLPLLSISEYTIMFVAL